MFRSFLQIFFLLILSCAILEAQSIRVIKKISLKKDQQKKIFVKYDELSRVFTFRWTLYKNDGLVVFHTYDNSHYQNILYLNYKNQAFRVELKTRGGNFYDVPYLLVKFKEFDFEKHKAVFEVFLYDKDEEIELKYPKNIVKAKK